MMTHRLELVLKNDLSEIYLLSQKLEEIGEKWNIQQEMQFNINLVLEELITNIINYGYSDKNEHTIKINISLHDDCILLEIIDDARPFNPLQAAEPDITASLEDRNIGGLGIFFVKKLMDSIDYKRTNNNNILTLKKYFNKN